MTCDLDEFELKIISLLQIDATLSTAEIAERVGLSPSPCWRRIQRLRDAGIIRAQVVLIDRRKVGLHAQVFAQVKLTAHGRQHLDEFAARVQAIPEVMECYVLMGAVDFMLRIVTADIDAYERLFFSTLSQIPGVQEINSTVALSDIKATTALPIPFQSA
ncbi:Lrp/AsnC family transcriptional regulator [Sphingomonas sp.]|uniref:Lrp/AsnC family transcriptional regulator n=1 Tax=Sphingomonas sp. TaxID=28214 RepID=UPI0025FA5992|nr:Lrp/AsnC family transcriptional regulator [Sphingomonas sp.]